MNCKKFIAEAKDKKTFKLKKKIGSASYVSIVKFNEDCTFNVMYYVNAKGTIEDSFENGVSIKDFAKKI